MMTSDGRDRTHAVLPVLAAGAHLAPEDGACLMEYTSALAGEAFSDQPSCTDPALAMLARLINDATSDVGRQRLGVIAADLTTASPTDATGAARLLLSVLVDTYDALGQPRSLERSIRLARRRLLLVDAPGLCGQVRRWLEPVHRHGSGRRHLVRAVNATACLPEADRDALLQAVLFGAVARHAGRTSRVEARGRERRRTPGPDRDQSGPTRGSGASSGITLSR